MAVALHVKHVKGWKQDNQAWGQDLSMVSTEFLTRHLQPHLQLCSDVVRLGSLWNELPDMASHSASGAVVQ